MKPLFLCCVLLILNNLDCGICKRGGGGGRGGGGRGKSSSGGGWYWKSSNKQSSSSSSSAVKQPPTNIEPKPAPAIKPSAPNPEPTFKKETSHLQQSSYPRQQTPVGWNVPGSHQVHPTGHQPQGAWSSSGNNYHSYPQQPGGHHGYAQQPGGYHGYAQQPGGYHGYPQQPGGYHGYPQQPGGYHGYPQQGGYQGFSSYPHQQGYSPSYSGYHPSYGGFNNGPNMGYGQRGGMFGGSSFGGGPGLMGGFAGAGMYGMKKKSGFFSGSTVSNMLAGMFIYHAASSLIGGLFKRPYSVHNYYNQPPQAQEEIKLPSNMLTLCEGNATTLCTTGVTAICTTNGTVLCVATMSQAAPCIEEKALCVNTSVPCTEQTDPLCKNNTAEEKEAPVNLPCFTKLNVDVNLLNETGNAQDGSNYKYCVTTMAVAGPEYKNCPEDGGIDDYRSVLAGNFTWYLALDKLKRPYNVHNYYNPQADKPTGEITMPLHILSPCIENATKLCAPGLTPICTTFGEIMCLEEISASIPFCEDFNTTCIKSSVPCLKDDLWCKNATQEELPTVVNVDFPCFANVTVITNLPQFDIHQYNGTIPLSPPTSFTFHYHYCVVTLGLPGLETNTCIVNASTDKS